MGMEEGEGTAPAAAAQSPVSSAPLLPRLKKALAGGSQGQCLVQEVIRGPEPQESMNVLVLPKN